MRCDELDSLLTRTPLCELSDNGARLLTHCLYPSSDPVHVYVSRWGTGFRVSDGGGALLSAIQHGRQTDGIFDKACRRHCVVESGGTIIAEPPSEDWLMPAILAVANASAMAAREAVELAASKSERRLNQHIYEQLLLSVSASRIAKDYSYQGRSGRRWEMDYAVTGSKIVLVKSVIQNGNSINSNYAAFGDIGDHDDASKFSVFDEQLKTESASLLRQVAVLVPVGSLNLMTSRYLSQ